MKNLLVTLGCILVFSSCNNNIDSTGNIKTPVPPNSIYQEGDIVYIADYVFFGNKKMPLSVEFIYRNKTQEMLMSVNNSIAMKSHIASVENNNYITTTGDTIKIMDSIL